MPIKEKTANTYVSAVLNSNGGPERIRTIDQAVAVPCLTTWLQGHKSAYLLYQITNVMSRKILFEIQPLNHYIFSF